LSDFAWPISWRWHIQAPWGVYVHSLTVNAPELVDNLDASRKLGGLLYGGTVATATVGSTVPFLQEMVCWRASELPTVSYLNVQRGYLYGPAAARDQTGVIVMHTGHGDGRARRRWYLGGMPKDWSAGGLLTLEGAENLQTLGRQMINGLVAGSGQLPAEMLIAYPYSVPVSGLIGRMVSFRRISHFRVCQYTGKVPALSGNLWPQED
jgi:hypothetical protein